MERVQEQAVVMPPSDASLRLKVLPHQLGADGIPVALVFDRNAVALTDAEFDAVTTVLTRYCTVRRVRPGFVFGRLARMLTLYVSTSLSASSPAPMPGLAFDRAAPGSKALRRVVTADGSALQPKDISRFLDRECRVLDAQAATEEEPAHPALPAELLDAALPAAYWAAVAAVAKDGPVVAAKRTNLALSDFVARSPKPVKRVTLDTNLASLERLFSDFVALSNHPSGLFAAWTRKPRGIRLPEEGLDDTRRNTGAPARRALRLAEQGLRARVRQELGLPLDEVEDHDEVRAIEALGRRGRGPMRAAGLFWPLRAWAVLFLLTRTGSRVDALHRLTVGDWTTAVTGYGEAPTLMLEPRKHHPDGFISPKPMKDGIGYPIEVFLTYLRAFHGELRAEWPLLPSALSSEARDRAMSADAMLTLIAGKKHWPTDDLVERLRIAVEREGRETGWFEVEDRRSRRTMMVLLFEDGRVGRQRALLPFDADADPYLGWTPHRIRSTCAQELESVKARNYLEANGHDDLPLRFLSEILLDHKIPKTVEALYKLTEERKQRMAGVAIELLDALLATDLGARRAPDVDQYKDALEALELHRATMDHLKRKRADLRDRVRRRTIDLQEFAAALDTLSERAEEQGRHRAKVEAAIERIEAGEVTVPWNDVDNDTAIPTLLSLPQLRAVAESPALCARRLSARVRDWLTVHEFAMVVGCTPKTVGTWLRDERPDTDSVPWHAGREPVEVITRNRRRILVDLIDEEWWAAHPRYREHAEDLLSDWPAEANWHPHRDRYASPPAWAVPLQRAA